MSQSTVGLILMIPVMWYGYSLGLMELRMPKAPAQRLAGVLVSATIGVILLLT